MLFLVRMVRMVWMVCSDDASAKAATADDADTARTTDDDDDDEYEDVIPVQSVVLGPLFCFLPSTNYKHETHRRFTSTSTDALQTALARACLSANVKTNPTEWSSPPENTTATVSNRPHVTIGEPEPERWHVGRSDRAWHLFDLARFLTDRRRT